MSTSTYYIGIGCGNLLDARDHRLIKKIVSGKQCKKKKERKRQWHWLLDLEEDLLIYGVESCGPVTAYINNLGVLIRILIALSCCVIRG